MKILLVGEFSGVHRSLSNQLIKMGHEVLFASSGDGWKQIDVDFDISFKKGDIKEFLNTIIRIVTFLYKSRNHDVVQFITPIMFPVSFGINTFIMKRLITNNKKTFLVAAGTDFRYLETCKTLKYAPFSGKEIEDPNYILDNHRDYLKLWNDYLANRVDGIIPVMYEYRCGYQKNANLKKTIMLPIDRDALVNLSDIPKAKKIKILYGQTRPGFKGEKYIDPALEQIEKSYSSIVEVIKVSRLPYKDYLKLLNECDILVDQALSYSYGMNAVLGLALGKVVLSGNESECEQEFNTKVPIVNICPDSNQIFNCLEYWINNPKERIRKGLESKIYANKYHDEKLIVDKYLTAWNQVL